MRAERIPNQHQGVLGTGREVEWLHSVGEPRMHEAIETGTEQRGGGPKGRVERDRRGASSVNDNIPLSVKATKNSGEDRPNIAEFFAWPRQHGLHSFDSGTVAGGRQIERIVR